MNGRGMKMLAGLAFAASMLPAVAQGGEAADAVVAHLYAGTASEGIASAQIACDEYNQDACFGLGLLKLVSAYEGFAQDLYRYGATVPGNTAAAMLFGMGSTDDATPANPNPEQLTYPALRTVLDDFITDIDAARVVFEQAGKDGDYVVTIDPTKVRLDLNGNGAVDEEENLGVILIDVLFLAPGGSKTKSKGGPDYSIGFDRADSIWFAGYLQAVAAPFDLVLAHDFTAFYDAYLHRVFPNSGLPMGKFNEGGSLFMDAESDAGIADLIAGIHTLNFPVEDSARLAGVLDRLKAITALSRKNWEAILAETDDNRELVPSPAQTSLVPGHDVTEEVVGAWMATLDTVDKVLAGELLVPHWRFKQGFDLPAYFQTALNTDLVLLITGSGATPYLSDDHPIADARSFSEANRVFGNDWLNYVFWFN